MNGLSIMFALLLCGFGAGVSIAADESKPAGEKRKEERKKLAPDEHDGKGKDWRKTNGNPARVEILKRREELKNMTPEERAAKRKEIKERLEKRIGELRFKQTNATLTAQETRELERREQILKRFEQEGPATPRIDRPKPILTNSPIGN
jgi:hypothetical protein